MKQKGHLYFSLFLLVVSGYAIYVASGWSFKTGFFPLAIAVPLLGLVLLHMYLEAWGPAEVSKGPAVEADFSGDVPDAVARRRVITIFAWIAGWGEVAMPGNYGNVNTYFWIPIVGPFLGGVIGAFVYDFGIRDTLRARGEMPQPDVESEGRTVEDVS